MTLSEPDAKRLKLSPSQAKEDRTIKEYRDRTFSYYSSNEHLIVSLPYAMILDRAHDKFMVRWVTSIMNLDKRFIRRWMIV